VTTAKESGTFLVVVSDGYLAHAGDSYGNTGTYKLNLATTAGPFVAAPMPRTNPVTSVTLSDRPNIVLNQNSPNPFAEQTTITYKIPNTAKTAKIIFHDAHGALMKVVDITSSRSRSDNENEGIPQCSGEGQMFVFGDDLSDGLYTYALVIDEKTVHRT